MSIRVIKAGALTTLQDGGRPGYQAYGVTVAGAVDDYAYCIANWLVGNDDAAAVLEMTLMGAELLFESDAIIALTGADLAARLNDQPLENWRSYRVAAGDRLRCGSAQFGCRSYLAVGGGIAGDLLLGSRSTDLRARLGGVAGRALRAGDVLPLLATARPFVEAQLPSADIPHYGGVNQIAVLAGPQCTAFTTAEIEKFYGATYSVSQDSNRMACRLKGAAILAIDTSDIISDATVFGSIQIGGDGQPMLLLADRQTTGGYAKIATAITSQRSKLAQLRPGDELTFYRVDSVAARRQLLAYRANLNRIKDVIKSQLAVRYGQLRHFRVKLDGQSYCVAVREIIDQ